MLAATLALLPASSTTAQALPSVYPPMAGDPVIEGALLSATNAARAEHGRGLLVADEALALAARHHAAEMARLRYFAHTSPVPENATLGQRVAQAGSPLVAVGENLALLRGPGGIAERSIEGWLESPGHRANLLNPEFTHVGFGVATDDAGATYVVQVLGYQPFQLVASQALATHQSSYRLEIRLRSTERGSAALFVGSEGIPPVELMPGEQTVSLTTAAPSPLHLQVGTRLGGNRFLLQDGGWLELPVGSWRPDPEAPRDGVEIVSVRAVPETRGVVEVALTYDARAGRSLLVFVDDSYRPEAVVGPGQLRFRVAAPPGSQPIISVGEPLGNDEARVFHAFSVDTTLGFPRLVVAPR